MLDKDRLKGQGGFTVVEFLVAITVLLIVAVAFVPLFTFIAQGSQANRARLTATNIATSTLEEIRSLPYNSVGTQGGNPSGTIPQSETKLVNGMNFTVTTNVWWEDDASDDPASGSDPIPYDYKRVKVSVSSPGLFQGSATVTADLDTLSTLDGEEEAYPGGNFRATVIRGWKENAGDKVPVEGAKVELKTGPDAPQTLWTDEGGRALFAILEEGQYTVGLTAGNLGLMVRPDQVLVNETVTQGVTSEREYETEAPCYLSLLIVNVNNGQPVTDTGSAVLSLGVVGYSKTVSFSGGEAEEMLFGSLWPVGDGYPGNYSLHISVPGYYDYELENSDWDGAFSAPGEHKQITVHLTPDH